jgi:hypothetical protein
VCNEERSERERERGDRRGAPHGAGSAKVVRRQQQGGTEQSSLTRHMTPSHFGHLLPVPRLHPPLHAMAATGTQRGAVEPRRRDPSQRTGRDPAPGFRFARRLLPAAVRHTAAARRTRTGQTRSRSVPRNDTPPPHSQPCDTPGRSQQSNGSWPGLLWALLSGVQRGRAVGLSNPKAVPSSGLILPQVRRGVLPSYMQPPQQLCDQQGSA